MKKIVGITLFLLIVFSVMSFSFATNLGETSYGYVTKEVYGNLSSNQTIVLIIGVHPQENGIHTAVANALAAKSDNLSKRYVIYKVHVTQDANDYTKGRMNGQLLAQQFIVPDVSSEKPMLVVDNHENHGSDSGYTYSRFLYPVSSTEITKLYTNQIISSMTFLKVYYPPNPTSTQYITVPIANQGIPTIIYETYMYDSASTKASHASALIDALDKNVRNIPTAYANSKGGLYNYDKSVRLYMSKPGTIYYTLNGSTPTTSSTHYNGEPILISSTTTLKFIAVDLEGTLSPAYTEKYTIDKVRPNITSVNIKNQATGVSRTSTIVIKFSENITSSISWNKFYIKNLSTGKPVAISKWISGNTLYLKTTYNRYAYTWYQVYIPGYSVKDSAGNNLASGYWFKFRTGRY
ncbi:Ig-like domain-containing protein [Methanobacterium oryzae]|uniref:Ig-like domain-containing protein n=1 Tax=Methanobacterium oryzae TaxID=69540 RepID=UPI003D246DB5